MGVLLGKGGLYGNVSTHAQNPPHAGQHNSPYLKLTLDTIRSLHKVVFPIVIVLAYTRTEPHLLGRELS